MAGRVQSRAVLLLALGVASLSLSPGRGLAEEALQRGEANDAGVLVLWELTAASTGSGHLSVRIADAISGTPYGFRPGNLKGWLQHRRGALSDAEMPCPARVVALVQQPIGGRAGVDLNAARLLTLNTNGSIAILNPALSAKTSRLEAVIDLAGRPINWARVTDRPEVWVLLQQGRLVLVDLAARRVVRAVELPKSAEGRDLAFDAAHRLLWVSLPALDALGRLDVDGDGAAMTLAASMRPINLLPAVPEGAGSAAGADVLAASQTTAVVAFGEPDEVTWLDGPVARATWHLGARPVAAEYSPLSRRLMVADASGSVTAVDPADPAAAPQRLRLDHPISAMALFDRGRRAFALGGGRASVIDLATMRSTMTVTAPAAASLVLTDGFLYAIDGIGDAATLWSLAGLAQARDDRTAVSLGSPTSAGVADAPSGLRMAVAAGNGAGVIAGHPGSDVLSAYAEGGMQPTDAYSNVRRAPIGLKLLDPSLRETAPGRYEVAIQAPRGGPYDLVLSGGSPGFAVCVPVRWPAMHEDEARLAPRPHAALAGVDPAADGAQRVRLHVADRPDGAALSGVSDMTLLVFDRLTAWQARLPLSETGPGEYEALVRVPEPGRYMLHASSRTSGLSEAGGMLGEVPLGGTR